MFARRATAVAAVIGASIALAMVVPAAAHSDPTTPRWIRHIQQYPGGISGGVRAMVSVEAISARGSVIARPSTTIGAGRGPNVQMNDDSRPPVPQNETSVAYSLHDPMVAVAAANDYVSGGVVVMRTADGGRSWKSTRLGPQFRGSGDFCTGGDPAVAYSRRDAAFYLTQLCFFRAASPSEIHLFKSVDGGKTWTPGRQRALVATNFDYATGEVDESIFLDKEYLTVDNFPGDPHYGRIYVSYTKFHIQPDGFSDYCPIQLSYTDVVPTFDPSLATFQHVAVQPDDPGGNGKGRSANQFSVPVVEKGGGLDIAFVTEECNSVLDHHFFIQKSSDGGASFLPDPVRVDPPGAFVDSPDPAGLLPAKKFRAPNTLSMAYSEATGTLAYVYTNYIDMAASGADVVLQRSTDGGLHWSGLEALSHRAGSIAPARNDQFFPWVAFSPDGTFYAIWQDCRRDPGNHDIDTFQARSTDDAQTFSNYRISTRSWDPDLGFFTSGSFIGDYNGLAASDEVVYPVWTDGRSNAIERTGIGETDIFTDVEILSAP